MKSNLVHQPISCDVGALRRWTTGSLLKAVLSVHCKGESGAIAFPIQTVSWCIWTELARQRLHTENKSLLSLNGPVLKSKAPHRKQVASVAQRSCTEVKGSTQKTSRFCRSTVLHLLSHQLNDELPDHPVMREGFYRTSIEAVPLNLGGGVLTGKCGRCAAAYCTAVRTEGENSAHL
eukprot:1194062-Prorocentrum_minimum.AAC.1